MLALEIAELKDSILRYLSNQAKRRLTLSVIYNDLNPENITIEVMRDYAEDLVQDKVIYSLPMSGGALYYITPLGKRRLREGGYTRLLEIGLGKIEQLKEDAQKYIEKTDLEIKNLQASLNHFKYSKRISIWAIIISVISPLVSIIFNII